MTDADPKAPGADAVSQLWQHVEEHWGEDKAHLAFVEQCRVTGQLLEAAKRYKAVSAEPQRSEQAQRRLNLIATLAMADLAAQTPSPEAAKRRAGLLVALLLLMALFLALLAVYAVRS